MSGGFREGYEEDDFGDLLTTTKPTTSSSYYQSNEVTTSMEDDISTNPFADMESSRVIYDLPPSTTSSQYESSGGGGFQANSPPSSAYTKPLIKEEEEDEEGEDSFTSNLDSRSRFIRENAPEPESPLFSASASTSYLPTDDEDLLPPLSPVRDNSNSYIPLSPSEQTPFGSPPPPPLSSTSTFTSTFNPTNIYNSNTSTSSSSSNKKIDLKSLLGFEKPILPTFQTSQIRSSDSSSSTTGNNNNTRGGGGGGGSNLLLPISSIGNKVVGSALATLLGLEIDESVKVVESKVKESEKKVVPIEKKEKKEEEKEKKEQKEVIIKEEAPLPPDLTTSTTINLLSIPMEALSLELPPSPKLTPTTTTKTDTKREEQEEEAVHSSTATLLTGMESQISHLSLSTPSFPTNNDTSRNSDSKIPNSDNTQHQHRNTTSSSLLFGDQPQSQSQSQSQSTNTASTSTSTLNPNPNPNPILSRGFKTFNDDSSPPPSSSPSPSAFPDPEQDPETLLDDDKASTRGNYSDSLRGEKNGYSYSYDINGDDISSRIGTGANSPTGVGASIGIVGGDDVERVETGGERESSGLRSESVDSTRTPTLPNKNSPQPAFQSASTLPSSPPPAASSPSPSPFTTSRIATESSISIPTPIRSKELGGSLGPTFIISVGDPQKVGSSLNVTSQHTVYTVRTQTTSSAFRKPEFSVLRRFSHFLWLFETLTISNPGVIVPGMPEKNALGRFGSDFVENRRSALQAALMKMVSHPMLVGDPDLRLFLESDSFSVDIKQRRLDTPSENKGFLASLVGSTLSSGPKFIEFDEYFENRKQSLDSFELQLRSLILSLSNANKIKLSLQNSIGELQISFLSLSNCDLSNSLKNALEQGAGVQRKLRLLSEQQSISEEQIGGIISVAEGYARLCGSVRLVFGARVKAYHTAQAAESVLRKVKASHAKRSRGDEMGGSLLEVSEAERKMIDTKRDFEDVSKLTRAEMVRFDKEKVDDFKSAIESYVEGMVLRQREVVATWQLYTEFLTRLSSETRSASSVIAGSNVNPV